MRVIIANKGTNITYERVATIDDRGEELILISSDKNPICITFNGWSIARAKSCRINKKWLVCVDEVFLDTRVEGV